MGGIFHMPMIIMLHSKLPGEGTQGSGKSKDLS